MKRFYKCKKYKKYNKFIIVIILIIVMDIIIFNLFANKLGENISYFAKIKLEEISDYYLNDTIKKYLNVNTNDYIKINLVNNNIVNVDINNEKSNELLKNIINDLENNVLKIEMGRIKDYHNLEMLKGDNGIIIFMPIGAIFNNSLFSRLGPKIPVRVSFLENVDAYVDIKVENYGINNSLIKLYINIHIEELIELTMNEERVDIEYKFLIASKLINGEVPDMLGNSLGYSSNIVNNNVN